MIRSMRRTVLILSLTTLALAASTTWLALELRSAREELAAARIARADRSPEAATPDSVAVTSVSAVGPTTAPPLLAGGKSAGNPTATSEVEAASHTTELQRIGYMRALLEDPEKRAKAMRDNRRNFAKSMPRLAQDLELGEEEYNRLLDLKVEQQFRHLEAGYRCELNPPCDYRTAFTGLHATSQRELVDLLGAEKAQRFADYQDNMQERHIVADFRGDLPDALRLSDKQAEKLVEVLGDERRLVEKEWNQSGRGDGQTGLSNQYGTLVLSGTAQSAEQRIAEASEFQRRQRERAAQVLTAGQLEVFTQRQQDMLEMARGSWEYEEQAHNKGSN